VFPSSYQSPVFPHFKKSTWYIGLVTVVCCVNKVHLTKLQKFSTFELDRLFNSQLDILFNPYLDLLTHIGFYKSYFRCHYSVYVIMLQCCTLVKPPLPYPEDDDQFFPITVKRAVLPLFLSLPCYTRGHWTSWRENAPPSKPLSLWDRHLIPTTLLCLSLGFYTISFFFFFSELLASLT
jgi:hypothetical protein